MSRLRQEGYQLVPASGRQKIVGHLGSGLMNGDQVLIPLACLVQSVLRLRQRIVCVLAGGKRCETVFALPTSRLAG